MFVQHPYHPWDRNIHLYLENQLLLISINFTPKTSHCCLKNGTLGVPGTIKNQAHVGKYTSPMDGSHVDFHNNLDPLPNQHSSGKAKLMYMGVSLNGGFSPKIIHFKYFNRVFHYFHHPFWPTDPSRDNNRSEFGGHVDSLTIPKNGGFTLRPKLPGGVDPIQWISWYGGFLKLWYPQNTNFNRVFHYKPSILEYHHFRKPPYAYPFWKLWTSKKRILRGKRARD